MNNQKATKKELIEQAIAKDIRFKKSWSKQQIQDAIASGIKNSDPIWLDCKLTNLKFDAKVYGVTDRTTVHPIVSEWKQIAFSNHWYNSLFAAIDYCKEQGFNSLEQFEEVFKRASEKKPFDGSEIATNLTIRPKN